jgi:hypothetical protein
VQLLERAATRLFNLDTESAAILRGDHLGRRIPEWKAALLRAHVEISAGRREIAAMRHADGGGRIDASAVDSVP